MFTGLKTPDDWCKELDIIILDPDGWRFPINTLDPKDWDIPISHEEFVTRLAYSTIEVKDWPTY